MTTPLRVGLAAVLLAGSLAGARASDLVCSAPGGSSCEKADVGFVPRYPDPASAPDYAVFTATLPGLGFLQDGDGDGRLNDEGCDPNAASGLGEGIAALATIVALTPACDASPENLDSACYVAMTVLTTALESVSIIEAQCGLQDGLVGGAEAEATYENTKLLLATQIELSLQDCVPLGTMLLPRSLGGRAEELADLVRQRIDQVATLGDTPIAVARAEDEYALALAQRGAGQYRDAFGQLCKAYKQLQLAKNK